MIRSEKQINRAETLLLSIFTLILLSSVSLGQVDLYAEKIETVIEWRAPASLGSAAENYGNNNTPLYTINGFTYAVFTDSKRRPWVVKYDDSQEQRELLVDDDYQARKDGHHKFSLGIDKAGYIHIAGDMHHHPFSNTDHLRKPLQNSSCLYWKSDKPYDISSFTFYGKDSKHVIPGIGFTYLYFMNDKDGTLYTASRQWVRNDSYWTGHPGKLALGVARYDEASETWTALGDAAPIGNNYPNGWVPNGNNVIFWEPTGVDNTAYQTWGNWIYFDQSNRMHLAVGMNTDNSGNGSHPGSGTAVCYAYSDDRGTSWHTANGNAITRLPMREKTADTVAKGHWYMMEAGITLSPAGKPLIAYRTHDGSNTRSYWREYGETSWKEKVPLPDTYRRAKPIVDRKNVITLSAYNDLYRANSYDVRGRQFSLRYDIFALDYGFWAETGRLRYTAKVDGELAIITLYITPDVPDVPDTVDTDDSLPDYFTLEQNYPNPFNESTTISYSLPSDTFVELKIVDIRGQMSRTLVSAHQSAGKHQVQLNNSGLATGVYTYYLKSNNTILSKKLLLLR